MNWDESQDAQRPNAVAWPLIVAIILLVGGIGLITWSFVGRVFVNSSGGWSQEQAHEYQAAAIKLHELSHDAAHAADSSGNDVVDGELKKAQAEYQVLRGELESAMARPKRIAWLLRIGGVLLTLVGGALLYRLPAPSRNEGH